MVSSASLSGQLKARRPMSAPTVRVHRQAPIVALLERYDIDRWATWDGVAAQHTDDPAGELDAPMHWIGPPLSRSNYRGCPQINVAAEILEHDHPSRGVARAHARAPITPRCHCEASRCAASRCSGRATRAADQGCIRQLGTSWE